MSDKEQNDRAAQHWADRPPSSGLLGEGRAIEYLAPLMDELNPMTLIEVGCGSGRNLAQLRGLLPWQASLVGVDCSAMLISYGKQRYADERIEFICQDVSDGLNVGLKADLVFSVSCLDHIPHPAKTLSTMLAKGRTIAVLEPYNGVRRFAHEATAEYSFFHDYPSLLAELGATVHTKQRAPMGPRGLGESYWLFVASL